MAEEEDSYNMGNVMIDIAEKMIRRHPHVFGDTSAETVEAIRENWEEIKKKEKEGRNENVSLLQGVPRSLPALNRALKITKIAARVGFDWPSIDSVVEKVEEEINELKLCLHETDNSRITEELGDILFSVVNLCRHAGVDPDLALRGSVSKFSKRFAFMERRVKETGNTLETSTTEEMDQLWELSKDAEKTGDAL